MTNIEVTHCHPHAHEGETLTVNYLRHHLPNGTLLVNYHLPDGSGTLEIDVVVINRNGIYLLEVKHWLGTIEADQLHWRHASGDLRPSPLPIIEQKAKIVNGFLKSRGWHDVSVVGLVVLSKGTSALKISDPQAHKVFGLQESLIQALTGREYVFHPRSRMFSPTEQFRLRQVLVDSHVADAERRVGGYRVLDVQDRGYYVELRAEDPEFPGRKVRIKQYDVPAVGSLRDLEEAVARFKRDMAALFNAGAHPNLVRPLQFLRDAASDERYYLVQEWAGEQTLAERLVAGPLPPAEQIAILKDIAAGLAHCHAQGVIHRNLTPESIYITAAGQAKVGDFDFAKVPSISHTLRQTGKLLVSGRHIAPEQAFNAPDIDERADIYALGVLWYDMLFRPGPDDVLERARIAAAPLSDDGKTILTMLVAERRSERPSSMAEVQQWLGTLS
jgi:serine/threonine protein kinase